MNEHHQTPQEQLHAHILVVDDAEPTRVLVGRLLEEAGASVCTAKDGQEAIERIRQDRFEGVFMDMRMPICDGYEATRTIRREGFQMPIVAVTGNTQPEDRQRCLAAGCSDYLPKPINFNRLLDLAHQWSRPEPEVVRPVERKEKREPLATVVEQLRQRFLDNLDEQWPEIQQALDRGDYDQVEKAIHWIKGTGGSLGLRHIARRASALEQTIRRTEEAALAVSQLSGKVSD